MSWDRARFPKAVEIYAHLAMFGPNLLASEGATWKRHRKTVAPAFSEANTALVWDESARVARDMFDAWGEAHEIRIDDVAKITLKVCARSGYSMSVTARAVRATRLIRRWCAAPFGAGGSGPHA